MFDRKEYDRQYYQRNKDKILKNKKVYQEENKEHISTQRKDHAAKNPEKIKERNKRHYAKNKEKNNAYNKAYYQNNKDKFRKSRRKSAKKKRQTDPFYRLCQNSKRRSNEMLSVIGKDVKWGAFETFFGIDRLGLKAYIEGLFTDGMTWENRGSFWELDHIIPISLWNKDRELLRKLNHYKNVRPLKKEENRAKGDSVILELWPEGVPFTKEELGIAEGDYLSSATAI